MELDYAQTIEQAENAYAVRLRHLAHLIDLLALELVKDEAGAIEMINYLHGEVQNQKLIRGEKLLPDISVFGIF